LLHRTLLSQKERQRKREKNTRCRGRGDPVTLPEGTAQRQDPWVGDGGEKKRDWGRGEDGRQRPRKAGLVTTLPCPGDHNRVVPWKWKTEKRGSLNKSQLNTTKISLGPSQGRQKPVPLPRGRKKKKSTKERRDNISKKNGPPIQN